MSQNNKFGNAGTLTTATQPYHPVTNRRTGMLRRPQTNCLTAPTGSSPLVGVFILFLLSTMKQLSCGNGEKHDPAILTYSASVSVLKVEHHGPAIYAQFLNCSTNYPTVFHHNSQTNYVQTSTAMFRGLITASISLGMRISDL